MSLNLAEIPAAPTSRGAQDAFGILTSQLKAPNVTFRSFIEKVMPRYSFYGHHKLIIETLERVASGELKRLMVFAPPRHGKSELISRLFPAYYLTRYPDRWVGLTSFGADLAVGLARNARANYLMFKPRLSTTAMTGAGRRESDAARNWETGLGGGMWAAGVGGAQTGKGFHVGIVDDPVKDHVEAVSPKKQDNAKHWWDSTFTTRGEEDHAMIVVMTRWNENDLCGYLLAQERQGDAREGWTVVLLPAIQEEAAIHGIPKSCKVISDDRKPGQPLWPKKFPRSKLRKRMQKEGRDGGYYWFSMYQQRPQETAGKGRICKTFGAHNLTPLEFDKGSDLWIGMDFNVDPMSLAIGHVYGSQFQCVQTKQIPDSHTEEACQWIAENFADWHDEEIGWRIKVCPDPTGRSRKTSASGKTDFSIIRAHGFAIRADSHPPVLVDRFNEMNFACTPQPEGVPIGLLLNEMDDLCFAGMESLTKYVRKPGTNEPAKGRYDHMFDAISMVVHQVAPLSKPAVVIEEGFPGESDTLASAGSVFL